MAVLDAIYTDSLTSSFNVAFEDEDQIDDHVDHTGLQARGFNISLAKSILILEGLLFTIANINKMSWLHLA